MVLAAERSRVIHSGARPVLPEDREQDDHEGEQPEEVDRRAPEINLAIVIPVRETMNTRAPPTVCACTWTNTVHYF